MFRKSKILIFFVLIFLSACSVHRTSLEQELLEHSKNPKYGPSNSPVTLEIADAFVDQSKFLNVDVFLTAKADTPSKRLQLVLKGLREGEIVAEDQVSLSDYIEKDIFKESQTQLLSLKIPSKELHEYQVECKWGEEEVSQPKPAAETTSRAKANLSDLLTDRVEEEPASKNFLEEKVLPPVSLRLASTQKNFSECEQADCSYYYTVWMELSNNSQAVIRESKIAVRLAWVPDGSTAKSYHPGLSLQLDEQLISLNKLNLLPGQKKKVKLAIDRAIPVQKGGSYQPVIRLLGEI